MGVNGGHIALELRVFAGFSVNRHLGIENHAVVALLGLFGSLSQGGADEGRIRSVEFLTQGLDQGDQVLLIPAGVSHVVAILVALPPEKSCNLILLGAGIIFADLREHFFRIGNVVVVLFACVPADRLRLRAFHPTVGRLLVSGVNPGGFLLGLVIDAGELVALASRWQQVPAEAAIADGAFQNHDRFSNRVAEMVPNADLDPDLVAADGEPVIPVDVHAVALLHHGDVADVLANRPFAFGVGEETVEVFPFDRLLKRTIGITRHLAHFERIGLAHHDEDLDRLGHVRRLAVGIGEIGFGTRGCGEAHAHRRRQEGCFDCFAVFHDLLILCFSADCSCPEPVIISGECNPWLGKHPSNYCPGRRFLSEISKRPHRPSPGRTITQSAETHRMQGIPLFWFLASGFWILLPP